MNDANVGAGLNALFRKHLEPLEKRIAELEAQLAEPKRKRLFKGRKTSD